jgi:hypothetical protein
MMEAETKFGTAIHASALSGGQPVEAEELASSYCPRCSARLQQRKCKMICEACGYYMSCSDFY